MGLLTNMQMSAEETKEYTQPEPSDAPKYPWGLCITLDDGSLEKLGVEELPEAGAEVTIVAKATVSSVRQYQTQGSENERSMELQITDMQIGGLKTDLAEQTAKKLYTNTKGQ
jgi:hypothetical protein